MTRATTTASCTLCALALALAACGVEPPCPAADLAPLPRDPHWAVVTSDFSSTAIGMLDADGTLITEAWLDSGTTRPGITATLSGDVVLPTTPLAPNELALIDRYGVDVLTRVTTPSGLDIGQVHLQSTSAEDTGFRANPQDVLALGDGRALVSRHNRNPNADATLLDRGNDIVWIDLARRELTGSTSLDSIDASARPSSMVRVGARVIVGLALLSAGFDAVAPGAIAVLDPATEAVAAIDLSDLANCGTVASIPGDDARAIVLCGGDPRTEAAAHERDQRMRAGIAVLSVDSGGAAHVDAVWRAREHDELPSPSWAIVSLGGTRVVYDALGYRRDGTNGRLVVLDVATGEGRVVVESPGELVFGMGAYDPVQHLLLMPDASAGLRRLDVGDGLDVRPRDVVDVSPCRHLPARQVRAIAGT